MKTRETNLRPVLSLLIAIALLVPASAAVAAAPLPIPSINIGVAAPMAFFPFGGTKGSFFGDLKAHGTDSVQFFTDKKVVISRWF